MFENVRLKCCLYRIGSVFAFKPIYYKLYYCNIFVRDSHWTILSYILTTYTASSSIYELFQIFSLQFRIVSNAVRVHRVPFLFSYTQILSECNAPITVLVFNLLLYSSKSVRMPSECIVYRACFQNVVCSSKSFRVSSECTIYRPCFQNVVYSSITFILSSE